MCAIGVLAVLTITSMVLHASTACADERDEDPGLVDLSGVWRYHAGDDPRWSAPGLADADWERRAVPVTTHTPSSGSVIGWYRRTVVVPSHLRERAVYMAVGSKRLCSVEVYARGRHIGGRGSAPPSFRVPASGYALLRVPPGSWDVEGHLPIAMRVWWLPSFGEGLRPRFLDGLDLPPAMGARAATLRYVDSPTPGAQTEWALALAMTLLLVGAGVYQLVVSRSSTRAEHVWLAVFALSEALALYLFAVWDGEIVDDAILARRLMLSAHVVMIIATLRFTDALLASKPSRWTRLQEALLAASLVVLLVADVESLGVWRSASFALMLGAALVAAERIGRAAMRGDADARVVICGFAVFLAVAAYEVVWTLLRLPDRSILPVGMLGLLGSMMVVVARRHARTADELDRLRQQLELRVVERTRELELANAQLVVSEERARRANEAKTEFLANMSHEIRTPMNGVLGMADVLKQDDRLTPEQLGHVETIRKSGRALLTILNDVLDLSKIEAGKLELESVPFAPDECAREVAELFAPAAAEKGVRLALELDPQIPRVRGAASRLRQVLLNLVGNAVKFTNRGEVVVRLNQHRRADGEIELRFEVRDTGIGIAREDFARLFQPFSQVAASSTRQHGGTGLGLVISKWLVERMGGRIDLRSEAGAGSIFSFFVVVSEEKDAVADPVSAPITAPPRSLRVLLVEDSLINQKVATLLLRNLDQRVALASDGQLAIDYVKRECFDVVLMDVQMPGMDGLEATRRIRADLLESQQPYIVALTASAMEDDRRRCLEAGMDDFLSKPIALGELAAALSRASRGRTRATRSHDDADTHAATPVAPPLTPV